MWRFSKPKATDATRLPFQVVTKVLNHFSVKNRASSRVLQQI
jgi:hypothetical protein